MERKNDDQPHDDYPRCGAKNRAGTPCQQKAGWGTVHVGTGRCKLHGGASTGAPKGNKNALKHGRYTKEAKEERRQIRELLRLFREMVE